MLTVETVFSRMGHESAKNEIGIKGRVDLFEVEPPAWYKNPSDFQNPFIPVLQMMDDAKIKHSIRAGVRVRKVLGIGNAEKGKPFCLARESFLCQLYHQRIDINAVQPARVKCIVNELRTFAPPAADLDAKRIWWKRSDLLKKSHLFSLDPGAHRAVDPDSFRPVDFHAFEPCLS